MNAMPVAELTAAGAGLLLAAAILPAAQLLGERLAPSPGGEGGERAPTQLRQGATASTVPVLVWVVLGAAAGSLLAGAPGALGGAGVTVAAMRSRGVAAQRRRSRQLERDVPALARSLGDSLRGGHSLRVALVEAASDAALGAAMREHLRPISAGLQHGASLPSALDRLAEGGGALMRLTAGTMALHSQTGGRLVSELQLLAEHADRAARAENDRAAATSQARATVRVVSALPLLALAGAELLGGGLLVSISRSPLALALLAVAFMLEIAAVVVVRAIVGSER